MAKTLVTDTDISLSSLHQQLLIKPAASNDSTTVVQIQNSAGTVVLNVDTTNNRVGIGTTAPVAALHVKGGQGVPSLSADTNNINVVHSSTNAQLVTGAYATSPYAIWLQVKDSTNSGASYPLTLNPLGGNVGIGTTSPSKLLHVAGDALINNMTVGLGAGSIARNTVVGSAALASNTTGTQNTAIGYQSLYNNTTGSACIAVGDMTLTTNTTGSNNTAVGYKAITSQTTASYNTSVGYYSMFYNTTGPYNTALGANTLVANTIGDGSTAVGYGTMNATTTGVATFGTIVGGSAYTNGTYTAVQLTYSSGTTAATYPTATIVVAGGVVTSVTLVTAGARFLDTTTVMTATAASIGGTGSGFTVAVATLVSGTGTAVGFTALQSNTTGIHNTAVGFQSLFSNTTGGYNTAMGVNSLLAVTAGSRNVAIGYATLQASTSSDNVAVGYAALPSNTSGSNNTALGFNSQYTATTASYNTSVGYRSLQTNTGGNNTAVGDRSLYNQGLAGSNTAFGQFSGYTNSTGSFNTFIGTQASYYNTTGANNTSVGYNALQRNSTGGSNTAVGYQAGYYYNGVTGNNLTPSNSVYIGNNTSALADGQTNQIVIGDSAIGAGSNTATLGNTSIVTTILRGNVGIGTTSPCASLQIGAAVGYTRTSPAIAVPVGLSGFKELIEFGSDTRGGGLTGYQDGSGLVRVSLGTRTSSTVSEQFSVLNSGNVGIGTTTPGALLQVGSGTYPFTVSSAGVIKSGTTDSSGSLNIRQPGNGNQTFIIQRATDTAPTGAAFGVLNHSNSAFLYYLDVTGNTSQSGILTVSGTGNSSIAGNTGIGTTAPNVKLDVLSGTVNTAADSLTASTMTVTGPNVVFGAGANNAGVLNVETNTALGIDVGGSIGFGGRYTGTAQAQWALIKGAKENATDGDYASYLAFGTRIMGGQVTERVRINSTGNVGIGISSPTAKLHVAGGKILLDNTQGIQIKDAAGTARTVLQVDGGDNLYLDSTAAGGDIYLRASGNDKLTIKATSGNVGIGTATPTSKLAVNGNVAIGLPSSITGNYGQLEVRRASSDNRVTAGFTTDTNYQTMGWLPGTDFRVGFEYSGQYHQFKVHTGAGAVTDALYIQTTTGNVGIGTTTPTTTLQVNGALALKSPTTVNAATYTMASTDSSLIITTTNCTITLLSAATYTGRILYIKNITAHSLTSNASNVVPLGSATAGTAILAATAGKFAMLQSDGTNWITMMSN